MNSSRTHKKNILVIVSRFPFPLDKGDKLRAYHQVKELSKQFNVTIVALSDSVISKEQYASVEKICDELHVYRLTKLSKVWNMILSFLKKEPIQVGYFYRRIIYTKINALINEKKFDHIYCQLIRTTEYVKNIHHIPKTLDYMDALSAGIKRQVKRQPFYLKWIYKLEAVRLEKYEQYIFDYFENKTIISEQDKNLIKHPEKESIISIPNGIDDSFFEKLTLKPEFDFVFVGNMSYPPNIEAVKYISDHILPAFPHSSLLISGSTPAKSVLKLTENNAQITLTGWVDDIKTSYRKGQIFLAPMMIGTGMQNKLLEAMAIGIPCVTTSLANNAIKAVHGESVMVGENADELISCINQLRNNNELRVEVSRLGSEFIEKHYSWDKSVLNMIKNI